MTFGLSPNDWALLNQHVLEPFKKMGLIVWVFGSRARGEQQKFSDIDLLYKIPSGKTLPIGAISHIKEAVENSNITIKVDIVAEEDLAESYRASVLKDRILV